MPIDWVDSKPPKAEPECGFHGDTCKNNTWRYVLVGLGVAFIILIVGAFLFKFDQFIHRIIERSVKYFLFLMLADTTDTNKN